jgi:catalase-peroxidase
MGLIYVNPEGPNGNPDPLAAAQTSARRSPHGDERRGDRRLIAGGHTLGKAHGAAKAGERRPRARGRRSRSRASAGRTSHGTGKAPTRSRAASKARGPTTPTAWSHGYFENLFGHEWELTKSPAGAQQWTPKGGAATCRTRTIRQVRTPDDVHDRPVAALRPDLRKISASASTRTRSSSRPRVRAAWFKLTHRDMGPRCPLLGRSAAAQLWQDPVPAVDHELVDADVAELEKKILESGLTDRAARRDRLGLGGDLPRQRQTRRRQRRAHSPRAAEGLGSQPAGATGEGARGARGSRRLQRRAAGGKKVSLADLIVLGGCAGVEAAAKKGGSRRAGAVHAGPHRRDAGDDRRRASFAVLEPKADGFRNFLGHGAHDRPASETARRPRQLLTLSAPEMTVLVGGLRVLGANVGGSSTLGVLHAKPGHALERLLREPARHGHAVEEVAPRTRTSTKAATARRARSSGPATSVDLVFGSNSQLRAIAEVYASRRRRPRSSSTTSSRPGPRS